MRVSFFLERICSPLRKFLRVVTVCKDFIVQGPVVQSIVSLTKANELVKRSTRQVSYNFITKYTDIFC